LVTSRPSSRLWPIDKLFIAYAAIMAGLLALAARHDAFALLLIFGHVAAIGALIVIARNSSPVAEFIHHWYLLLYLPFCYKQVPYLVTALRLRAADNTLAHWDLAMWKVDPVFWLSSIQGRLAVEFLQAIYTMFIPGLLVLALVLWIRRPREEFRLGTFTIALTFLISYLGYLLLPARGPRFMEYASHYAPLQGLWAFHSFQNILDKLEGLQYDCFPSGHVAVVLVGCWIARRISSRVFYTFAAFAVCITFSTVYLRYHYVIDVIAGMALAIVVIAVAPLLYHKLEPGNKTSSLPPVS
jgi:membrane-associated phospholipid phosphatase